MTAIVRADAAGVRVLHGLVGRDGGLSLWAEDGAAAGSAAGRGAAPPHPFAVAVAGLPAGDPRAEATVLLPSTGAGPLPSPHLGLPPRRGTPRGRAWRVPAVSVPFVDVDLVAEFEGRVAPSAGWLVELCGFAASLVRRGRVLPGVRIDGPRPVALWRPVVTGADAVRCAALRDRMPPACRAEQPATGVEATAGELMAAALGRLVDGLVRTR
ncbi:ATP-dependent helicase, partial [Actinoplanes philippinensis]